MSIPFITCLLFALFCAFMLLRLAVRLHHVARQSADGYFHYLLNCTFQTRRRVTMLYVVTALLTVGIFSWIRHPTDPGEIFLGLFVPASGIWCHFLSGGMWPISYLRLPSPLWVPIYVSFILAHLGLPVAGVLSKRPWLYALFAALCISNIVGQTQIRADARQHAQSKRARLAQQAAEYIQNRTAEQHLYDSICDGDKASVHRLLEQGVSVNSKSMRNGYTPLLMAIAMKDVESVELLLDHGASPDTDPFALHYAALDGSSAEVALVLFNHGWSTTNRVGFLKEGLQTPLDVAMKFGEQDKRGPIIEFLRGFELDEEGEANTVEHHTGHVRK